MTASAAAALAEQVAELQTQLSNERAAHDMERTRNLGFRMLYDDTLQLLQNAGRMKLYRRVEQLRDEYGLDDDSDIDESDEDSDSLADEQ